MLLSLKYFCFDPLVNRINGQRMNQKDDGLRPRNQNGKRMIPMMTINRNRNHQIPNGGKFGSSADESSDKRSNQWAAKAGEWKKDDKSPSKSWSDSKDSKDSKSWSTDKRDTKWSPGKTSEWNK